MINYSQMTYQDVIDEVIFRLSKYRVAENFSTGEIEDALNRAIQSVFIKSLPYKDWAYKARIAIANGTWLTERYVKHERVLLSVSGNPPYQEARYASPQEYFTVTDWSNNQIWNTASVDNPVFTIYGNTIYCSPTIVPQSDPLTANSVSGFIECYLIPDKQSTNTAVIPIPFEYEEMVILETLLRIIDKVGDRALLWTIVGRISDIEQNSGVSFKQHKYTEKRELESFVSEDETPFNPPQPIQGELQKDLL